MKRSLFLAGILLLTIQSVIAQSVYKASADTSAHPGDTIISNFLYIPDQFGKWPDWKIIGFVLKNVDSSGTSLWQSDLLIPLDKDEKGYFVKTDIPARVSAVHPSTWCSVVYTEAALPNDTLIWQYGGVRAGDIKLKLRSAPQGAETFLVPNRTWILKIKKPGGIIDYETVERKYRVNGGMTEISALVDETVYVVVYKLNGKYKSVVHYTKPKTIEAEQTVFVNF